MINIKREKPISPSWAQELTNGLSAQGTHVRSGGRRAAPRLLGPRHGAQHWQP